MDVDVAGESVASSLDSFVVQHAVDLFRYGYLLTGDRDDTTDVVQEALVWVATRWARIAARTDPQAYVHARMARLQVSRWRQWRRAWLGDRVPPRPYHETELARVDGDTGLWRALAGLPARQRTVLVLRYHEQHTDRHIARTLRTLPGTVRRQATQGLDTLRGSWTAPPPGHMTETTT